jgi:hypothetical protein
MSKRYVLPLFLTLSVGLVSGCRYFKSEASLQIQALNGNGEALRNAKVLVNKVQVGHTDDKGFFKGNLELPVDEPLLVEVSKPSTDTFYAPYFETIKVKRGDVNTFKLTATLYGIKQGSTDANVVAEAQPTADAGAAIAVSEPTEILSVSGQLDSPTLATATDATAAAQIKAAAEDSGRPLTYYIVSGRDPVENASVFYGDATKKQWKHGCYTNASGRCSFKVPEHLDNVVTLVRAKGFQTQSRTFQLLDGDKVRFELSRGKSLEVFAISPLQGNMEGVESIKVSLNGKYLGLTDRFGSFIAPLDMEIPGDAKVQLEADQWLPAKSEISLNAQSNDSIIQHFQSIKPIAPKIAVMDFVVYRDKTDASMLNPPTQESLQMALNQAGANIVNGPALSGKFAEQKVSLNDLTASTWSQLRKVPETLNYVIRPSFVEGPSARIILSAIDSQGQMVYSASQSVKAKGSTQAVLTDLSNRILQNIRHEGAIVEAVGEEFRINIGKSHGIQTGDKIQITGNIRLASGEISSWDTIASAVVSEAGPERSRIKLIQTQPNSKVEAGNSVSLDRRPKASGEAVAVSVLEEQSQGPIGLAEVYSGDQWLGSSDLRGEAQVSEVDLLKTKDIQVFSPGYTPKTIALTEASKSIQAALSHEATPVQIESQPSGALVKINGRDLGRTPIDTDIPYPGPSVNVEIGGVDGFEYITRAQAVGSRGIVMKGNTHITLNRDPQQAARVLASEGKLIDAAQILEGIPESDASYLLAQHQLGELYLNQLHDPVKAASAFHKVTTHEKAEGFKDKRFIGTYINEAVALYQAGEQAMKLDNNLAISYWRQAEVILSRTEEQLRYVPQAQYNQAVHTLSYYRALSLHKTWTLTQNAEDQEHAMQRWKDYIQGTALALPQDQHYEWVKKAEGFFQQIQTARNKPRNDARSPVAM